MKAAGDEAHRSGSYEAAVEFYTEGIALDPTAAAVLHSNRSAAHMKQSLYEEALRDAERCVELGTMGVKGLARKAAALQALERYEEALELWIKILGEDSTYEAARDGAKNCLGALMGEIRNPNKPFLKYQAHLFLGGIGWKEAGEDFDRDFFDEFLSTFLPVPGKPRPIPGADQKVPLTIKVIVAQGISKGYRTNVSQEKEMQHNVFLPLGALHRMCEDGEFRRRASMIAVESLMKANSELDDQNCAICGKPSTSYSHNIGFLPVQDPPALTIMVDPLIFVCDKMSCQVAVNKVVNKKADKTESLRQCAACNKFEIAGQPFQTCSGCKLVSYCDRSCQRSHWKEHRPICREASRKSSKKK
jgi:hypothetical protein